VGSQATIGIGSSSSTTSGLSTSATASKPTTDATTSTTSISSTQAADASDGGAGAATRTNYMGSYTPTSSSSATTTPSSTGDASSSGGLTVGAQAGIGVGVGALGIGLGATVVYLCMRKRRTGYDEEEKPGRSHTSSPHPASSPTLSLNPGSGYSTRWIEPGPAPQELPPPSTTGLTVGAMEHGRPYNASAPAMSDTTTAFCSNPEYHGYTQPQAPAIPEDSAKYAFPPPGSTTTRRQDPGPQELDTEPLPVRELPAVRYR
jgi:hypothetical protein